MFIEKFKSGDTEAFGVIFHDHYRPLSIYAHTILKDMDDAEDTVQQVFISLWEKRTTLTIHTSLKALLYKSVHNSCLNRIKQQKVRSGYAREVQLHSSVGEIRDGLQQKELQQKIEEALTCLPEQCAKIFKMNRFEQLKYQEIADQLSLSIKTVENQMGKALKIMREQLKEYLPIILIILSLYCFE